MTSCNLECGHWRFWGTYRLHLQGRSAFLKMEAIYFLETLVSTYKTTRHHNLEDQHRHLHRHDSLNSEDTGHFYVGSLCRPDLSWEKKQFVRNELRARSSYTFLEATAYVNIDYCPFLVQTFIWVRQKVKKYIKIQDFQKRHLEAMLSFSFRNLKRNKLKIILLKPRYTTGLWQSAFPLFHRSVY
jgi:hypothetical protein